MDLVSVQEGADERRLSHWTVRAWLSQGKLTRYKLGGRTLVDRNELSALIRVETPAEAAARNSKRAMARGEAK